MTVFVVIAFVAVAVSNGTVFNLDRDDEPTGPTLISRPILPGADSAATTAGGVSARCKDGTYYFAGNKDTSNEELCKANGGVEKRLP